MVRLIKEDTGLNTFEISYKKNGVYQSNLVDANSAEEAKAWYAKKHPDATILGVHPATSDSYKPGKPHLKATAEDSGDYFSKYKAAGESKYKIGDVVKHTTPEGRSVVGKILKTVFEPDMGGYVYYISHDKNDGGVPYHVAEDDIEAVVEKTESKKPVRESYDNGGITSDLSEFGYRELDEAADLLRAYADGKGPDEFEADGVTLMFNSRSGYVFLTNSEYQVAMIDSSGELAMWHTTPYSGHEGFAEDLKDDYESYPEDWDEEDVQYLIDNGIIDDPNNSDTEEESREPKSNHIKRFK